MSSIGEQLRATLLSLKQLSDRVKSLITTSVTKSEATADKNEILAAIGNIPAPDMSAIAKQGSNANATLTDTQAQATAAATAAQAITGYALQGSDSTATNTAIKQAILDNAGVPTITIPATTASQELAPNTLYVFASRSAALTLTLGTPITGVANEYHLFLITDSSTAPTVTWPSGISWNGGSAPTIAADKTYEVSILNNVAAYFEV